MYLSILSFYGSALGRSVLDDTLLLWDVRALMSYLGKEDCPFCNFAFLLAFTTVHKVSLGICDFDINF